MHIKDLFHKDVIRDTAFVFFMTYWVGFIIGYLDPIYKDYIFIVVNLITGFTCFSFICLWTHKNRFQHIFIVAFLLWVLAATESILHGLVREWLISGAWTFSMALLALGLVSLFKKQV